MNVSDIIATALEEYDKSKKFMKQLRKKTLYQVINPTNPETQRTVYKFLDRYTTKHLFSSEGELLALYYKKFDIWSWPWANTNLSNGETYYSKQLIKHAINLGSELSYIKSILITSRGLIKHPYQIDINLAISSYIIKHNYILVKKIVINEQDPDDYVNHYIILLNNTELDKMRESINAELNG